MSNRTGWSVLMISRLGHSSLAQWWFWLPSILGPVVIRSKAQFDFLVYATGQMGLVRVFIFCEQGGMEHILIYLLEHIGVLKTQYFFRILYLDMLLDTDYYFAHRFTYW